MLFVLKRGLGEKLHIIAGKLETIWIMEEIFRLQEKNWMAFKQHSFRFCNVFLVVTRIAIWAPSWTIFKKCSINMIVVEIAASPFNKYFLKTNCICFLIVHTIFQVGTCLRTLGYSPTEDRIAGLTQQFDKGMLNFQWIVKKNNSNKPEIYKILVKFVPWPGSKKQRSLMARMLTIHVIGCGFDFTRIEILILENHKKL